MGVELEGNGKETIRNYAGNGRETYRNWPGTGICVLWFGICLVWSLKEMAGKLSGTVQETAGKHTATGRELASAFCGSAFAWYGA